MREKLNRHHTYIKRILVENIYVGTNHINKYLSYASIELTLSSDWFTTRLVIVSLRKLINMSDSRRNSLLPRDMAHNALYKVSGACGTAHAIARVDTCERHA